MKKSVGESFLKYGAFIVGAILLVGAIVYFSENRTVDSARYANVNIGESPVLGSQDAPVTIVEFADYQCPYCEQFWSENYFQLKKDYIETGKAKLVFMNFPIPQHANALPAANAAECVRSMGGDEAYWKMHDLIFANQDELSQDNLKKWADSLGFDITKCLEQEKFSNVISAEMKVGMDAGVQGTPTFFINGKELAGAQPYSSIKEEIDSQLMKSQN